VKGLALLVPELPACREDLHVRHPLHKLHETVSGHLAEALNGPIRPPNFHGIHFGSFPESEVQSRVAVREIAVTASPLGTLDQIGCTNRYDRADGVSIAGAPFESHDEEVLPIPAIVPKDRRRTIQVVDHDIEIAVVVEIAGRGATAHRRHRQRGARR
jgi:hypothetical protein